MTDSLAQAFADSDTRTRLAESIYRALDTTGEISRHRTVAYRCAEHRCLLLDVVDIDGMRIVHHKRYKNSPAVNDETSSESGRVKNTEDGDRRWVGRTYDAHDAANYVVSCDHVSQLIIELSAVSADVDAGHAEVRVRRDGSRYAIR